MRKIVLLGLVLILAFNLIGCGSFSTDADFDFTFVRPVSTRAENNDTRDEAPKIVINIGGSDAQHRNDGADSEGENAEADATAENGSTDAECGEATEVSENSTPGDAEASAVQEDTQTERRTQRIELDIGDDYIPIKRTVRTEED